MDLFRPPEQREFASVLSEEENEGVDEDGSEYEEDEDYELDGDD